jgi:hypothetical protein
LVIIDRYTILPREKIIEGGDHGRVCTLFLINQVLTNEEILFIKSAYSKADSTSGQAHRRKSGHTSEISINGIDLTKIEDIDDRHLAVAKELLACKQIAICLLKFGDMLKFLAGIVPRESYIPDGIVLELVATNKSNNSRIVCPVLFNF